MRKIQLCIGLMLMSFMTVHGQQVLTLDSCRALALRNNKQVNVARLSKDMAYYTRKSARTKYLPKVDVLGGYEYTSREINLLSKSQKNSLRNMGTNGMSQMGEGLSSNLTNMLGGLVQQGQLTPQQAQQMGSLLQSFGGPISQTLAAAGNSIGQQIVDAFHTDTHNIFAGSVIVKQPVYMGGAIVAANKIADISEQMADNNLSLKNQSTLYNIDQAYWTVVSLRQKQKLANSYRDLVKKLDDDVEKMVKQGVATRADRLKVNVRVNEADMQITQVDDGLVLAKMLLCQLCGLPMDSDITLADENSDELDTSTSANESYKPVDDFSSRPEIRLLQNTVDISEQNTKLVRAEYLPHIALTGGYAISNPNVFNGFQKKFGGVWNVGVMVQMPAWTWFDNKYKIRASKAATSMARMELADAQEKVDLQITQSRFKLKEARKRLAMAEKNIASAEENLRCAQVGFKEGVMETTDVMAAQTAWQQAQSQKIDAQVDVKLSQVNLQKALGILY